MIKKIDVLVIGDNLTEAETAAEMPQEEGEVSFSFSHSRHLAEGLAKLRQNHFDIVLLDLELSDSLGIDTVRKLTREFPAMPVIALAHQDDETVAIKAIQGGIQDYLIKGRINHDLLSRTIRYSIERKRLAMENARLLKDRERMEAEIRRMENHDSLTGLPNKRLFLDILNVERERARRQGRKMAVLFLGLDGFKEVNDALGRDAGDILINLAAARLRSLVRKSDTVARIGGDEFNIVLADIVRPEDAADIVRKIMESLRWPFRVNKYELQVTACIGISIYPDDDEDIDALLRYADSAMRRAKESGRDNYRFYNDATMVRSLERVRFESMLRHSLDTGEMLIYYQPLVDVSTRRIVCAEALLRWSHPEKGLLSPSDFISVAEQTGFITAIDEWVLRSVCAQVRLWRHAGLPQVCVSVNLSVRQFQDPGLADMIGKILKETGTPGDSLNLEISETTVMDNVEQNAARLRKLTDLGVHISIDRFGTGYSSLNNLKRLPIERLKIDQSFIRHIPADPDDRTIVRALTAFGHHMRLKVAAEGVETEDQLTFLTRTGCDEIQGYFFSEPVPAEKFEEMLGKKAA